MWSLKLSFDRQYKHKWILGCDWMSRSAIYKLHNKLWNESDIRLKRCCCPPMEINNISKLMRQREIEIAGHGNLLRTHGLWMCHPSQWWDHHVHHYHYRDFFEDHWVSITISRGKGMNIDLGRQRKGTKRRNRNRFVHPSPLPLDRERFKAIRSMFFFAPPQVDRSISRHRVKLFFHCKRLQKCL